MCKMCEKGNGMAKTAMGISLLALLLTIYVFFTHNNLFGIAGTQWILISILFGVYSLFLGNAQGGEKKE
jgi:hypothetical protein